MGTRSTASVSLCRISSGEQPSLRPSACSPCPLWYTPLLCVRRHRRTPIARISHYDRIARQWHRITGWHGGAFKQHVLNDLLLDAIASVEGRALLELGAGNGYFLPLALRRFSGQAPVRLVVSDASLALLHIAQTTFFLPNAEYLHLDVREPFPFQDGSFDLILATMLFNELTSAELRRALDECHRVLAASGMLLTTVVHPDFTADLARRGVLCPTRSELAFMPGAEGVPLPMARRSVAEYTALLTSRGFNAVPTDVYPDEKVLRAKPGLRNAAHVPLALVFICRKVA